MPPYEAEVEATIANSAFKAGLSPGHLRLALANAPKLFVAFQKMAHVVLFQGTVDEREREIAIIRTGALTRSEYEWGMHVSIYAERCGLDERQIEDLTLGSMSDPRWTDRERLIVHMVDELHEHSTISAETWTQLDALWPHEQIVELVMASSFYHMAAFFLNSMAVPLEDGARRFPAGIEPATVPGQA